MAVSPLTAIVRSLTVVVSALTVIVSAQTTTVSAPVRPIPGTGALGTLASASFTFVVAGDNRPAKADDPPTPTTGQVFAAAKALKASFVVWTGDMIYGLDTAEPTALARQYAAYFALARTAGAPVFAAPGNHEMDVKIRHDATLKETGSAQMEAQYRTNMGLPPGGQIYGAFTYGNSRFILLNSEEVAPPQVPRSAPAVTATGINLDPGYMSPAQIQWLTKELASNTAVHTFLFIHHPIKPKKADMGLNKANADELTALFARHRNISYVLGSHEHLYFNPQTNDISAPPNRTAPSTAPPIYLVSGGAGAPLSGTPADGGFYHYLVFTVTGNSIQVRMVKL